MTFAATPPSLSLLDDLLAAELASQVTRVITIHAGHYALFRDRMSAVTDHLYARDSEGSGLGFEEFSRVTWKAACRSVAAAAFPTRAQFLVLVNDWQFISSDFALRRENERDISRLREQYYMETPRLPAFHLNEMKRHGLSIDQILRHRKNRWLFSESALRTELHPLIDEVLADQQRALATGVRKHFKEDGEPIVDVYNDETGSFRLLYCGNTNCAGEVVSLIRNLYLRGVRRFLNLYPSLCREPVAAGTSLAYRLFNLDGLTVTNVAISGATNSGEDLHAVVERFNSEEFTPFKPCREEET